jgi:HTH-like domain
MAAAKPLWGAPRIHGELNKAGVEVSEHTVSRLLRRMRRASSRRGEPSDESPASLVSMDFLTVPTLTGRVLFVFVLLAHHRRRIVHFNLTEHSGRDCTKPAHRGLCRITSGDALSPSRTSAVFTIDTNGARRNAAWT